MTLRLTLGFVLAAVVCGPATATVFINEVFINPPGSLDDTREFIELFGTPGKKLDGYAIALANGTQQKYYPLGSIPPAPNPPPEIDEFFSLDGLALGANGILVIGIGVQSNYSTLLADSNFQRWNTIYNGGLDTPGNLQNDGSNTVLLIRQRPGRTQSDPLNPAGLRWGKDIPIDDQLFTPVVDPQSGQNVDQFGDGEIDSASPAATEATRLTSSVRPRRVCFSTTSRSWTRSATSMTAAGSTTSTAAASIRAVSIQPCRRDVCTRSTTRRASTRTS